MNDEKEAQTWHSSDVQVGGGTGRPTVYYAYIKKAAGSNWPFGPVIPLSAIEESKVIIEYATSNGGYYGSSNHGNLYLLDSSFNRINDTRTPINTVAGQPTTIPSHANGVYLMVDVLSSGSGDMIIKATLTN